MTQFDSRNDTRHAMQHRAFVVNYLMMGRPGLTDEQRLELANLALEQAKELVTLAETMVEMSKVKLSAKAETDAEFEALVKDLDMPKDVTQLLSYGKPEVQDADTE